MAEAYAELEKKLGAPKQEQPAEEAAEPTPNTEEQPEGNPDASDVQQAVEAAGVDFSNLQNEYNEQGQLTEESYKKLAEAGFPQDLVNSWIAGQEALNNSYQSSVHEIVGGAEAYGEMVNWASDNLTQSEIAAYDKAVDSGDLDMVKLAVEGLQNRYRAVEGKDPSLVQAGQSESSTGGSYGSWAEVTQAMSDPRYHSDPAYRQAVATKLERSNIQ